MLVSVCGMEKLGRRIREARERLGWSQDQLAVAAGTSQSTIDRIEKGGRSLKTYDAALAVGIQPDQINQSLKKTGMDPLVPNVMAKDNRQLPIFASAEGGAGQMLMTRDPIGWVVAPGNLSEVPGAFGIYVVGDSMEPAYSHGHLALVHPHKPPRAGDDVMLVREDHGTNHVMIKRLRGSNGRYWKLHQFNPPPGGERDFDVERSDWPQCLYVIGRLNSF